MALLRFEHCPMFSQDFSGTDSMENKYPSTQARLGTKPGLAHAGFRPLRQGIDCRNALALTLLIASFHFFLPSFLSH